jgi:hypothetical protein
MSFHAFDLWVATISLSALATLLVDKFRRAIEARDHLSDLPPHIEEQS